MLILLFNIFVLLSFILCHPHKHNYNTILTPSQILNGEIPPFRSFHAHVLFNNRRADDTCNGIDNALELQIKYKKYFNISDDQPECQADFDLVFFYVYLILNILG